MLVHRQATREMTAEADRLAAVAELVRQVRHDANNPLTAALGLVQLTLESNGMSEEELKSGLRVVEGELLRLVEILRRLKEIRIPAVAPDAFPPGA